MFKSSLRLLFPSQPQDTKPASVAGFSFIDNYGGQNGFDMKYVNYRLSKLSKGKKWYVSFSFKNPKTGKFQKFKVYENINRIKDLDERKEYGKDLMAAVNRALREGFNPFVKRFTKEVQKTWTLGQGLNYFKQKLGERGLRKRTIQSYQSVLKMLYKNLAPLLRQDIKEITKNNIKAALSNNKWSNTTYNNNLTFTKAIFNFLIDTEILKENPAQRIKPLPETISKHRYFDNETWNKIKEQCPTDLLEFILFLYHTGMRPNEARQIKYEHIQGDKLLIPATISKNRKEAFIPLSKYMIEKYKTGSGFIFGTSVNHYSKKFLELRRKLKLSDEFTLYSIKATRAIHLAEAGASPYSIMSLFRHSSLEMTMKYLRGLGLNLNREAAEKGIRF